MNARLLRSLAIVGFSTAGISVALAACSEEPTAATERMEAPAEEFASAFSSATPDLARHVTASQGGYEITFDPAWSSRSLVQPADGGAMTELYRQKGAYDLTGGQIPKQHEIRFSGGPRGRDVALAVLDPRHSIARIHVAMYGEGHVPGTGAGDQPVEVITVQNEALSCPPICSGTTASVASTSVAHSGSAGAFAPLAAEHRTVTAHGYTVAYYPGFAREVTVAVAGAEPRTLHRQSGSYKLPAGQTSPAGQHEIQLRGGKYGRDVALRVHDPKHEIAHIVLELHGPDYVPGTGEAGEPVETITIQNDAKICPPFCEPG